jgi:hypothetical protein
MYIYITKCLYDNNINVWIANVSCLQVWASSALSLLFSNQKADVGIRKAVVEFGRWDLLPRIRLFAFSPQVSCVRSFTRPACPPPVAISTANVALSPPSSLSSCSLGGRRPSPNFQSPRPRLAVVLLCSRPLLRHRVPPAALLARPALLS